MKNVAQIEIVLFHPYFSALYIVTLYIVVGLGPKHDKPDK